MDTLNAELPSFQSSRSYWNFAKAARRSSRYIQTPETKGFLDTVLVTCQQRVQEIPAGNLFWRAQLGHKWRPIADDVDDEIPCAFSPARMLPLPDSASDGRANPRGIPCLYVATNKETAMSEVRPWMGSYVSVSQLRTSRDLKIVDCARLHEGYSFFLSEPNDQERNEAVWRDIDQAFAEPVTRSDDHTDYVPTQILAELFKHAGFDGVVYRSKFGENGFNIAIFDTCAATVVNGGLFQVKTMNIDFEQSDDFYHVAPKSEV